MKRIPALLLLCFVLSLNAQSVTDYKYIVVPSSFSGFDTGQYQLNNYLKLLLTQKQYEVLPEGSSYWPSEAKLNPCLLLHADVDKEKSTFKNKVNLSFKDCNNTVVAAYEGSSSIKEFEEGYKDALNNAMSFVGQQQAEMPTYRNEETKQVTIITTNTTDAQEILPLGKRSVKLKENASDFKKFSYNGQTVFLTNVDQNKYILTSSDKSKILAEFYPSSIEDIFHVKVYRGNMKFYYTIGSYDGQTLWYEYTDDNEIWTKIEFESAD